MLFRSTRWETRVQSLGQEDPLEKEMALHSSTLAWKIPWTEDPDADFNNFSILLFSNSSSVLFVTLLFWLNTSLVALSDSATPWTVAHQAPLSMGLFTGKNTGMGCHFL